MERKEAMGLAMLGVQYLKWYWENRMEYWDKEGDAEMWGNAFEQAMSFRKAEEKLIEMYQEM